MSSPYHCFFTCTLIQPHLFFAPYVYSVNQIVPPKDLLRAALSVAQEITTNSPDAVQSSKECLLISQKQQGMHETVTEHVLSRASTRVYKGDNIKVSCDSLGISLRIELTDLVFFFSFFLIFSPTLPWHAVTSNSPSVITSFFWLDTPMD